MSAQLAVNREMTALVFVPLAHNQARFYLSVARHLRERGYQVAFVSLHQPSLPLLRAEGFEALDVFGLIPGRAGAMTPADVASLADRFGMGNVSRVISHEKVAYEIKDTGYLLLKLAGYTLAIDEALGALAARLGDRVQVIQELGGFLAVLAAFHVSRRRGVDVIHIEPSFFRGRVVFLRNTLSALSIEAGAPRPVTPQVRDYLEETLRERRIVIPSKDAHHYRSPWRKVLSPYHLRRFVEKSMEKHVLAQREEFSYLKTQVIRHVRSALTEARLRRHYRDLDNVGRFIYYPLHVAADVALTIRAPEYLDQYALLDYLARTIPITHRLAIKEHPAMVGGLDYGRVHDLLRRHDTLVLLRPSISNFDVLRRADAVVTVNSKSGAEAILLNRPVVALGESFYRRSGLVRPVASLNEIGEALLEVLSASPRPSEEIYRYFQEVWDQSYPGELYAIDDASCGVFADSLIRYLKASSPKRTSAGRTV